MASIFTYDNASRVSSPWSTPGASTPQAVEVTGSSRRRSDQLFGQGGPMPIALRDLELSRLEPEPQDGSVEYKLHLLLRPRRKFSSMSTSAEISGRQHSRPAAPTNVGSTPEAIRPVNAPSTQTRQARLQQLTTQLLWRLQQSSPFHSSSAANLILPMLPEATPKLGVPERPSKLLPGLEESQGALYEIGVADDGTLVGLIQEELQESLTNLRAMAASLGCIVDIQRKVIVGDCEWTDSEHAIAKAGLIHAEQLWVAEALVRPDLEYASEHTLLKDTKKDGMNGDGHACHLEAEKSETEQLRVALTGSSTSGKSSLLGTLTTSILDNGRGKSRLSLLKHRHEIASGITSSVAQELVGYQLSPDTGASSTVINYSSTDVSSWSDIHNDASRLVFLSDSPGLPRYAKSTFRTLTSWQPHWTIVCVAADEIVPISANEPVAATAAFGPTQLDTGFDSSLQHLQMCLKLELSLVVVVTKLDIATRLGLRSTLASLLSMLKNAGRKPVLLPLPSTPGSTSSVEITTINLRDIDFTETQEISRVFGQDNTSHRNIVPIVLTSSVTGAGLTKLHALLSWLAHSGQPQETDPNQNDSLPGASPIFMVDEVFMIPPSKVYSDTDNNPTHQGVVLCGYTQQGTISVGDHLALGPFSPELHTANGRHSSPNRRLTPTARSLSAEFSKSLPLDPELARSYSKSLHLDPEPARSQIHKPFITVRVVSLRNLRLPVRVLLPGQVGTIGVVPTDYTSLTRARKGMVLTNPAEELGDYRTFTATFPATEFASMTSPPLILGGHAIIYINSIRAAVKVTAVARAESEASEPASPQEGDVFEFDGDEQQGQKKGGENEIKITFRFVNTTEWMRTGDRVLVVPSASMAGPVAGPNVVASGSLGVCGFVGRVCEGDV